MQQEETILLQAMYEEYLIPLKKFAAKLGAKIEDIEDLVHETFIEYYMRYPLDLPDKVRTVLLIRILRSKWIDGNRRVRGREILRIDNPDDRESILKGLMNSGEMLSILDREVLDRETYRALWEIVKKMKTDWRDVIILRIIEGIPTEEAAEILGISGTVCRSRLSRAKKVLREKARRARIFDD